MPNILAYLVLIVWPIISIQLFAKLNSVQAFIITVVGGYLILPVRVNIDFPLIPALDKSSIVGISLLIGCRFVKKLPVNLIPPEGIERKLVLIYLLIPIFTTITNQEIVFNGAWWTAGLTPYDMVSAIIANYLYLIPLILGVQVLNSQYAQEQLFKIITVSALIYSVFILFEVRMSPQLHNWIYGFFPHSFAQQMRDGGFRAVVFLGHGLLVSIFLVIAIGSVAALWKNKNKQLFGVPIIYILLYFIVVLILQKSLGALLLGIMIFMSVLLFSSRLIALLSLSLITIVILYPSLSLFNIFPQQGIVELAQSIDPERSHSLNFRFYHENALLEHARHKILFGWGGWGRGMLYDSIPDGQWIITLGTYGTVGFIAVFGLGFASVFRGYKMLQNIAHKPSFYYISIHMLVVSAIMIDQIPNDSLNSFALMIIGCLLGIAKWTPLTDPKR